LHRMTKVRLIQLMAGEGGPADGAQPSYKAMITPAGLKAIATYAYGVGPDKAMLWNDATPSPLVADAHAAGLRVHPWTYRAENVFEPARFRRGSDPAAHGDIAAEIDAGLAQGIDGFFTDFPLYGAQARGRAQETARAGVK
jgi:glycerophosphoryl diester phosphodiesterase